MSEPVSIFQRHLTRIQGEHLAKQVQDAQAKGILMKNLAHDALWGEIAKRIRQGKARDEAEGYGQLAGERHPLYQEYWKLLEATRPPPSAEAIAKSEEDAAIAKRRQVLGSIEKRAGALVSAGHAADMGEAYREIFKHDPAAYQSYRNASYAEGSPLLSQRDGMQKAAPPNPAYQKARDMARDMKVNDVFGTHVGKTETALIGEVFANNQWLYEQHRAESVYQG